MIINMEVRSFHGNGNFFALIFFYLYTVGSLLNMKTYGGKEIEEILLFLLKPIHLFFYGIIC